MFRPGVQTACVALLDFVNGAAPAFAVLNMAVVPAVRFHQPAAPERPIAKEMASPGLLAHGWSANIAITRRSIARLRSSPDMTSRSTAEPWRTGLVVRAGGWSPCRRPDRACVWVVFVDDTPSIRATIGLGWTRSAGHRLLLGPRSQGGAPRLSARRIPRHPPGSGLVDEQNLIKRVFRTHGGWSVLDGAPTT